MRYHTVLALVPPVAAFPQAQPAASPAECEQIVGEIVGAIATAHWDPAVRCWHSSTLHSELNWQDWLAAGLVHLLGDGPRGR